MPTPNNIEEQHYFDPTYLNDEALKVPADDLITTLERDAKARRIGRPPGSKNKPKMDRTTGQLTGGPRSRPSTPKPDEPVTNRKLLAEKKDHQDKWKDKIITEWNDSMFELFIQFGIPQEFLYNPGYGPSPQETRKYTPYGKRLAIKPLTAHALAATLTELEYSNAGAKLAAKAIQDSPLRLAFFGIASIVMVGSQVKAVLDLRSELQPYIEAWQQAKQNEKARRKNQGQQQQDQSQEEQVSGLT